MYQATILYKPINCNTIDVGDTGDIKKVWVTRGVAFCLWLPRPSSNTYCSNTLLGEKVRNNY